MAITGLQLLQETGGELSRDTFPTFKIAELETQLSVWSDAGNAFALAAGLSGATADAAAFCWAYHLAYLSVWQRLVNTPSQTSIEGQGSVSIGSNQAGPFKKMADEKKECAERLANQEAATADNEIPPPVSIDLTSKWGVR